MDGREGPGAGISPSAGAPLAAGEGKTSHPAVAWLNLLESARARARAATAVLLDAKSNPADAWVLLDLGWRDLLTVVTHVGSHPAPPFPAPALGALLATLAEQPVPGLPTAQRAAWRVQLQDLPSLGLTGHGARPPTPRVRRVFLRLCHQLERCARVTAVDVKARLGKPPLVVPVRRVLASLVALAVSGGLGWAVAHEPPVRETGWRSEYYADETFGGKPLVRRDPTLAFFWHEGPAYPGGPPDHFSAKFDTCLKLDEKADVTFSLGSDDGSRLWVDGTKVVDHWGGHGVSYKEATTTLEKGLHHLHTDYYEYGWGAAIILRIGVGKDKPDVPDARLLVFPGFDPIGATPCAGLE